MTVRACDEGRSIAFIYNHIYTHVYAFLHILIKPKRTRENALKLFHLNNLYKSNLYIYTYIYIMIFSVVNGTWQHRGVEKLFTNYQCQFYKI